MKLNEKNFAIASGLTWGLWLFVLTIISTATGYAAAILAPLSSIYIGYTVSYVGSIIGLIWGFIDAGIGMYILAWIYNKLGE